MSNLYQNLIFVLVLVVSLLSIFSLIRWSHAKYRHLYVNNVQDFSKHYYRYLLYFWGVGIFIPSSEIILEIFKIREQSELYYNLLAGAICLGIGFASKHFKTLRENLHRIFVGFFVIFNILTLYRILYNPMDLLTLAEFTIFLMISYYVFYKVEHFYIYFISIFSLLLSYRFFNFINVDAFIIYFNSALIAFTINYVIHFIDLNAKENLFFAYNIVNKGNLLVIGVDNEGVVVFVSENIREILDYNKEEWIGKNWHNEIMSIGGIEDVEALGTEGYLQKFILTNNKYKLIEWRDEPSYNNLAIKIGRDITESQRAKVELKRTQEILEQTNRVARVGGWEFDLVSQKGYSSEITKEIFEVPYNSQYDFQTAINYFEVGEHRNKITNALENCIKYGIPYDFEIPIITAKGNKLWIRAKGAAEFENNECKRIYGTTQDIDEQVKAKEALIESEQKFRFINENISDVIIVFDKNKVIYLSPTHEKQFGYSSEEAIRIAENDICDFIHPDEREYIINIHKQAAEKRTPSFSYTFRFLHKNGNYVWREDLVDMIYDENGSPLKFIVLARDISERKAAELANQQRQTIKLQQNNILIRLYKTPFGEHDFWCNDLKTILEAAAEGVGVGRVGIYDYVDNSLVCRDLYNEETNTHSSGDVLTAKDFPAYFEGINSGLAIVAHDAYTHPNTFEFSETYLTPLGITSMLDISIRVAGELVGVICWEHTQQQRIWTDDDVAFARSIADIISLGIEADKRRKAEDELKNAKELLEQTNRVARVGGWEYSFETKKFYYSEETKEIFEVSAAKDSNLKRILNYFEAGKNRNILTQAFENCVKFGTPYDCELQIITEKRNKFWIRTKGAAEFENGRCKRIYGIVQDIDERVKLSLVIKERETQYRTLLSRISSVTFRCLNDEHWTMLFISDAIKTLTGYPASDFIQNHKRTYLSIVHPDDKKTVNSISENTLSGKEYSIEYRIFDVNNNIIWVQETGQLFFDETENKHLLDGIITNITERKNAESKLFENQAQLLFKSKILAAIAQITEKLLVSTDIEKTLNESFTAIGEATNVDRAYFFENDIETNRISMKVEWVRDLITPQLNNPATQNLSFDDIYFYTEPLLQNKIYQNIISSLDNTTIIERWNKQDIKSVLLFPIFIKNTFYGFIGFDDCTNEQLWSDDQLNILQSLATNIANAIERINNEKIIKESENNFRQINETIEDVFLLFDVVNREYIYVSPSCKKVLDADQEFFYSGQSYVKNYLLEDDQLINDIIEGQLLRKKSSEIEYRIKTKDGQIKWIHQKSFAIHNEKGELVRISGICSDITEKKLIQNEIKQLSLVAEKITNGVIIADSVGHVLWANQALLDMMEIPLEIILNKRLRELFSTGEKQFIEKMDSIEKIYNHSLEIEVLTYTKNKKWVQINNTAIRDEENKTVVQQIEVIIDITERKKAEMLVKESEEKFRFIAENTSDGIFVIENRLITYTSPSFEKILGYTFADSVKHSRGNLLDLVHPEDVSYFAECITNAVNIKRTNFSCQYRSLHKDGHYIWREDTITAIYDGDKVYKFISVVRDITERKKAEEQLKESERKLSSILNALDEIVWAVSLPDYKLSFVSQSFERIYGRTTKELKINLNIWQEVVYDSDKEIAKKAWKEVTENGIAHTKYRIIDGKGNIKWIENDVKVVRNENNEPFMIMGITTDITDKKLAEAALIKAHEEADAANKSKAELELRALQMQMNPHFVFNALNSIQSYVMSHDTLTANNYLSKFAHLIRLFLDSSRSKFISLGEEIRLLTLYIELEKLRFDEKFDFEIGIDASVSKYFEIPTMILQPFIENAINHGLRYKKEKGLLSIKFYSESNYIICKIEDNGVGRKKAEKIQSKSSKGYKSQGLKITAERLMTYNKINDANIVFSINDKITNPQNPDDEVGTSIEIKFPENN